MLTISQRLFKVYLQLRELVRIKRSAYQREKAWKGFRAALKPYNPGKDTMWLCSFYEYFDALEYMGKGMVRRWWFRRSRPEGGIYGGLFIPAEGSTRGDAIFSVPFEEIEALVKGKPREKSDYFAVDEKVPGEFYVMPTDPDILYPDWNHFTEEDRYF